MSAATETRPVEPKFDTTPEIRYVDGRAVRVTTYCLVNGYSLSNHDTNLADNGTFTESCFDEHHCICRTDEPVSVGRLRELDAHNPHCIPILDVLGKTRPQVEAVLKGRYEGKDIVARHIE